MLIWGTKAVKRRIDAGEFHCPQCGGMRSYTRVRAQRHGHVYWIPLFATGEAVEYVECGACGGTFDPAVLDRLPPMDGDAFRDHFGVAVLATTMAVAAADGRIDDAEIDVISGVVSRIAGRELDREAVVRMAAAPGAGDLAVALASLTQLALGLSAEGKELVVKAALFTAMADGDLDQREMDRVFQVAAALEVTQAHLKGIVADVGGQPLRA